jgi:hypothetical protein
MGLAPYLFVRVHATAFLLSSLQVSNIDVTLIVNLRSVFQSFNIPYSFTVSKWNFIAVCIFYLAFCNIQAAAATTIY